MVALAVPRVRRKALMPSRIACPLFPSPIAVHLRDLSLVEKLVNVG